MNLRYCLVVIVAFGASQWIAAPQSRAEETSPEVKNVLLRMRQHLASINSVNYSYERSTVRSLPGKAAIANNTIGEFGYSKGKFWDHFDSNYQPDKISFVRKAFDGKFYQRSMPNELVVGVTPQNQKFNRQPLLQSFEFVILGPRYDFEVFTDEAAWLELAKSAKLIEPQTVRDYKCDVIQLDRPAPAPSFSIFAARDLGSYPIRVVSNSKNSTGQGDVLESKRVDTAEGFIVIPTKYEGVVLDEKGVTIITYKYTLKLNSLNEPLADSKFYITGPEKVRAVDLPNDVPDDFAARRAAALKKSGPEKPSP